jgi:hypothetical protein
VKTSRKVPEEAMGNVKTEPTTEQTERGATKTSHPAFAMIGAHRSSVGGGVDSGVYLYGSDFKHQAVVTIRIHESEMHREVSRDWPFARGTIAEVTLSEAQWATFVSSLNCGDGVPCTLNFAADRGGVPGIAPHKPRIEQASGEITETLNDAVAILDDVLSELKAKGRANDLKTRLAKARQEIVDNLPFVAKSFDRHMEGTVEKAKSEVHGYMTGVLARAGLAHLAAPESLPLQLTAQGIDARSDETPKEVRPEGREPGPERDAPKTSQGV